MAAIARMILDIYTNVTLHPLELEIANQLHVSPSLLKISRDETLPPFDSHHNDFPEFLLIHIDLINVYSSIYSRNLEPEITSQAFTLIENKYCKSLQNLRRNSPSTKIILTLSTFSGVPISQASTIRSVIHINQKLSEFADYFINFDLILGKSGLSCNIDWKNYYRFDRPYTSSIIQKYAKSAAEIITNSHFPAKKVVILDLDQTLWPGVIDQDGISDVLGQEGSAIRKCFTDIQYFYKSLAKAGVLICVVSKNNLEDVLDTFSNLTTLDVKDIVSWRVNWKDKVANIVDISHELSLGLDSFLFVDDSVFEINNVALRLPQVKTFHVPDDCFVYLNKLLNEVTHYFPPPSTLEDRLRAKTYQSSNLRKGLQEASHSEQEYLSKLDTRLSISVAQTHHVERIYQLSQRTNQFNLTTIRYAKEQIQAIIESNDSLLFICSMKDKFSDLGLIGAIVVTKIGNKKEGPLLESFWFSCRALGRFSESAFLYHVCKYLIKSSHQNVFAQYKMTMKNSNQKNFYANHGFSLEESNEEENKFSYKINESGLCGMKNIQYADIEWE